MFFIISATESIRMNKSLILLMTTLALVIIYMFRGYRYWDKVTSQIKSKLPIQ
jgi:hypothetical protein